MAIDRKLRGWIAAGLIDEATAARIRDHEAASARPLLAWAMAGLGLFAAALGVLLLVAANWDRIPAAVKLVTHLLLLAAAAVTAWRARGPWVAEGALFAFAALLLAGVALQAQVFQLTGETFEALVLWAVLATPALLIGGTTRLTGLGFAAMWLVTLLVFALDTLGRQGGWWLASGLAMAGPFLLLLLAGAPWAQPGFRRALGEVAVPVLLAAASIAHFAWASHVTGPQAGVNLWRMLLPLAAGVALLLPGRWPLATELRWPLVVGPLVAVGLALGVPHPDIWWSRLLGVLLFAAMWGWVAWGAARSGASALFAVAIAALAARLFIVYIELFGSQAATGGGLLMGGGLLVALAWGWHRIVRVRA